MKINLGNGIILEDLQVEDVKEIIKEISHPTIKAAKNSVINKVNKKSSCNNQLDGRREQICEEYFVNGIGSTSLAKMYGVTANTITYTLKSRGVLLGYLNEENIDSYKDYRGKCIQM